MNLRVRPRVKLKKKEKKIVVCCSLLLTWDISSRSRAITAKDKQACKLSCCFANLNLLLFTVYFVAMHCICLSSLLFEGSPATSDLREVQRLEILSLTKRRFVLFSGTNGLSGRKTPIGPVAGHYKNPKAPFGLGLKAFCFSSDNVFWNSCIQTMANNEKGWFGHRLWCADRTLHFSYMFHKRK